MKKIIFISIIFSFISLNLIADTFDNPVSISLGDAYLIKASGYRALGWNPANLALYDNKFTISLSNLNLNITNNAFSIAFYNDLVGQVLDEGDEQDILDRIPDSGFGLYADVSFEPMITSFSYKNFAFSSTANFLSTIRFSKGLFEFLIEDIEFQEYDFSDCKGELVGFYENRLGYAQKLRLKDLLPYGLPPIYGGISISYIMGVSYAKISKLEASLINSQDGATIDANVKIKTCGIKREDDEFSFSAETEITFPGSGFRMDIGFLSKLNENITVGLAFKNLFGSITWSNDCQQHIFSAYGDSIFAYSGDYDFGDQFEEVDTTYSISEIKQTIPFEIHMGGKYELKVFNLYADYVQGFESSAFTSSKPKISLGAEYDILKWLPIRLGFGFGDERSSHYSLGSGLEFKTFAFSWALRSYYSPVPSYAKGLSYSAGVILKF